MTKENQHFIPQGHLRQFCIDGEKSLVWEYDKMLSCISREPQSVRKVCSTHHYYAQVDDQGNLDKNRLEDAFSKYVEDPGIRVINSIPKHASVPFKLCASDRTALALFVAFLSTRVPAFRDGVNDLHEKIARVTAEHIIGQQFNNGEVPEIVAKSIKERGIWGTINLQVEQWVSLRPMVETAIFGAEVLLKKQWMFFKPDLNAYFLTSDNPYVFLPPLDGPIDVPIGPFNPYATVMVPLRKDLYFIASSPVGEEEEEFFIKLVSNDKIRVLNDQTIRAALRYIYGPISDESVLERVKKLKGTYQKMVTI